MTFEHLTNIEKPTTPVEEQEAINALVDAINWAKPNAWYIRYGGAEYKVGDVVNCPYFRDLELRCTKAGTTANNLLNKAILVEGATITDGSVKWFVQAQSRGGAQGINASVIDSTLTISSKHAGVSGTRLLITF